MVMSSLLHLSRRDPAPRRSPRGVLGDRRRRTQLLPVNRPARGPRGPFLVRLRRALLRPWPVLVVVVVAAALVFYSGLTGGGPLASSTLELGLWEPHGLVLQCPAVPRESVPVDVRGLRVMIAANLKDNGPIMANFIEQLMQLVRVFEDRKGVLVSIYESNSKDDTPQALQALAQALQSLGIRHRIVTHGADSRRPGEHRIAFLARMRNKALEPLLKPPKEEEGNKSESSKHYDRIVFINDVYFCAWQVLRLLSYGADMSCGLDFKHLSWRDKLWRRLVSGKWRGNRFYDIWVARDEAGQPFIEDPPVVKHAHGKERREGSSSVLPEESFGAYCCWNGMAVLDAKPFYSGLTFRTLDPPQPIESECSLLCDDLWATAKANEKRDLRVVVDPAVRLSYDYRTYGHMDSSFPPLPASTTPDALVAPPNRLTEPKAVPLPASEVSCGLAATASRVDYSKCTMRPPLEYAQAAVMTNKTGS